MKKTIAISLIAGTLVTVAVNASAFPSQEDSNACWDVYSNEGELVSRVVEKGASPDDCTPGVGCFETLSILSDERENLVVPMGADPATACVDIAPPTTTTTDGATAEWLEVEPGIGSLNGARRIVVVEPYPDAAGVCFTLNGLSNRCDATGRNEGSEFHFYPTPNLVVGDTLVATWTSGGIGYESTYVVPDPDDVSEPPVTTVAPTTEPPSTTNPPTTAPPATNPPTTAPPATNPPTTAPPVTNPPTTAPPATNPPTTAPPVTNPPTSTTEWLEVQPGQGSLNGARRVAVVAPYPDGDGVCFALNGVSNRCDATGRNEGSEFHFFPIPNLAAGDELVATWTSDGVDYSSKYVVPAAPANEPPTPQPPAPQPPTVNGTAFVERFEDPNSLDNWDAIVVNGQAWNHRPTSWNGDHDANCGGPGTTRKVNWPVLNNNIPDVRPVGDTLYWCAPAGPGSGHIMTSFLTGGYAHIDFTPKRHFTDVRRVCWDQNVTNLGNRKWTQVTIVPKSTYDAVAPRLDWTRPDKNRPNGPADWGLDLTNGSFMFSTTLGDAQTYTSGMSSDRSSKLDKTVADKKKRVTTCLEDLGNGKVMVEQERYNGAVDRTPLTGAFPDGDVKVVFQDVSYNPNKAETPPLVSNAHTWHWDDIIIES